MAFAGDTAARQQVARDNTELEARLGLLRRQNERLAAHVKVLAVLADKLSPSPPAPGGRADAPRELPAGLLASFSEALAETDTLVELCDQLAGRLTSLI